ncbi:MAG TPA: hypothetical protein VNH18_25550 [Bryobacteraceae bacterium]|nr:hypothetical protein [Bryobacteraceae bacterium]
MENFRDFEIGPDPFGRTWHVQFKYLQTGISIRHADSVDVCFLLESGEEKLKRVVVLQHPELLAYSKRKGVEMSDTWCSRLAAFKLKNSIETGEDIEKEYLVVSPHEIEQFDYAIRKWEETWLKSNAA